MSEFNSVIVATGGYLPERIVTNAELAKRIETSDEWIVQRTGIKQRHVAADDQPTSALAIEAAKDAMTRGRFSAGDIDGIIVATTTPDRTFPAVAVEVQAAIGMTHGFAFDVQAVCSGFIYALGVANGMLQTGQARRLLVIGAEKMSSVLDWNDRKTCVLFGDGAGAIILEAQEPAAHGILATRLYSDGRYRDLLKTNGGVATTGSAGTIEMQGPEVFKHAVNCMRQAVETILAETDTKPEQVDWLVPHQANRRIIETLAEHMHLPMDKIILTVGEHANTSAASIPLALHQGVSDGRIQPGQLLLLESMGGGFTWGAALIRY